MHSINFYHLSRTDTYVALCKLLVKAFEQEINVVVRTNSTEVTDDIDERLWSFDSSSFMPHSKLGDVNNNLSPIYVTSENDNPNNAVYLFILNTSNFSLPEICEFERTFILFNNDDKYFLEIARKLWLDLESFEIDRKYWVQGKQGWELKKSN